MTGLINGSFEEWGEDNTLVLPVGGNPYLVTWDNVKVAAPWMPWYVHEEGVWDKPESKPAETPERLHGGSVAACFYTFYRDHWGGHKQTVNVPVGATVRLSAWAHAWSATEIEGYEHWSDNPHWSVGAGDQAFAALHENLMPKTGHPYTDGLHNFHFRIGIDPTGNDDPLASTVVWSSDWAIYNEYHQIAIEMQAQGDVVTAFLQSKTTWPFKHNDAYWDDARLTVIGEPPEPDPDERQYKRTVHLIPQDTNLLELAEVIEIAAPHRQTITWSADDAWIDHPNLTARYVNVWDVERVAGSMREMRDWVEKYYPPEPNVITYRNFTTTTPPEPEPEPPYEFRSIIGFQQQMARDYRDEFIARVKPPVWLLINGFEEAAHIKSLSPTTKVAVRHVDNAWGDYLFASDIDAAAARWLNHYGQTLFDQADNIDYVLGLNEYIATNDYNALQAMPYWIEALINLLDREGWPARLIGGNLPVGNPQSDDWCDHYEIPRQTSLLVPSARLLADNDCLFGYHAYWGVRNNHDGTFYCTLGRYEDEFYSMRALLNWDPVFRAAGVKVHYAFTEGGPIYISPTGSMVSSDAGWKWRETYDGNTRAAIGSVMQFDQECNDWMAEFGDYVDLLAIFLHGGHGQWEYFDWAGAPSWLLADALT